MKIDGLNNNVEQLVVKYNKTVKSKEIDEKLSNSPVIQEANTHADLADDVSRNVILANIDAASSNPELLNNLKFFNFHTEKDYDKTSRQVGKNINIYDTDNGSK